MLAQSKTAQTSARAAAPTRSRPFLIALWGPAVLWIGWLVGQAPYTLIRSQGDNFWRVRDIEWADRALFFGHAPTRVLQNQIYDRDVPWLDYVCYLTHGFWFGVPFAFGMILMIYQRRRLMEFLGWQLVLFHICAVLFFFLPVRPPWMEPGIDRVLMVRNFGHYVEIDNNPAAAFPSLHAALPAMVAMFYFMRCQRRLRFWAWLAVGFTLLVSFAIVYMGEHWVVDVLGGVAVAALTAWLCTNAAVIRTAHRLPGDPLTRLARFNDLIYPESRGLSTAAPHEMPGVEPRAA